MRVDEITALPRRDTMAYRQARKMPHPDISHQQRNALKWYRQHGYDEINSKLRGIARQKEPWTDAEHVEDHGEVLSADETIARIDAAMLQSPKRKASIIVYRGETDPERAVALHDMVIGESYVDPGFLSTSLAPSYAFYFGSSKGGTNLLSLIRLSPSVQGIYVSNLDHADEHTELEFLVDRQTRYTLHDRRIIPNRNPGGARQVQLLIWNAVNPDE